MNPTGKVEKMSPEKQSWWKDIGFIVAVFSLVGIIIVISVIINNMIFEPQQENWEVVKWYNRSAVQMQYLIWNQTENVDWELVCDDICMQYVFEEQIPIVEGKDCKIISYIAINNSAQYADKKFFEERGYICNDDNLCEKTTCSTCRDYNTKKEVACP